MNAPLKPAAEFRAERLSTLFRAYVDKTLDAQHSREFADWHQAGKAWQSFDSFASTGNYLDNVIGQITASAADRIRFDLLKCVDAISLHAESPTEVAFHLALRICAKIRAISLEGFDADERPDLLKRHVAFTPQKNVGPYRADVLLSTIDASDNMHRLVVECDGHDFHERTREQASRDRARDRYFQEQGFAVYRFTGSDIYRDPYGCADQAMAWVEKHTFLAGGIVGED